MEEFYLQKRIRVPPIEYKNRVSSISPMRKGETLSSSRLPRITNIFGGEANKSKLKRFVKNS